MIVLLFIAIACAVVSVEAWMLMLGVGMAHLNLLEILQPISYGVSVQFVLLTLPAQVLGLALSALGDS